MLTIKNRAIRHFAMIMALVALAGCTPPGPRALLDGKRFLDQGKYPQALQKFKTATSLLASNSIAWNYLGLAYHHTGQPTEAAKAYIHALYLNRELDEARYNLGCVWLEQNKFEEAKAQLTTYILRRGNSAEALLKLGTAQLHSRELTSAETSFTDSLRLQRQNPEAWNGLGLVRLQRGRADEAAQCFRAALKLQPNYRPAVLNLAIVCQQYLRDPQQALHTYQEYLALKPPADSAQAVTALVRQLEQQLHPPAPPAVTNLMAKVETASPPSSSPPPQARNDKAEEPQQPVTQPKPKAEPAPVPAKPASPPVVTKSAPPPPGRSRQTPVVAVKPPPATAERVTLPSEPVLKAAQDVAEASSPSGSPAQPLVTTSSLPADILPTKVAKRSLFHSLNPFNLLRSEPKTPVRPTQIPVASEASSPAETPLAPPPAIPRYTYKSPPKPAEGNRSQAGRFFESGAKAQEGRRFAEAIRDYRQAVQLDPALFEAQYNLGLSYAESGDYAGALPVYEVALAIVPDSLDARYNFALALEQANYTLDAIEQFDRLLAKYPNEARAHLALGNIYAQQLHQPDQARAHYLRVLELDPRHSQASAIRYWLAANPQPQS